LIYKNDNSRGLPYCGSYFKNVMRMDTKFDNQEIYCRKLGHHLHFDYCRQENQALPCKKMKECWCSRFDVEKFIARNFSADLIKLIESPPIPKITAIVDLITQVKNISE